MVGLKSFYLKFFFKALHTDRPYAEQDAYNHQKTDHKLYSHIAKSLTRYN